MKTKKRITVALEPALHQALRVKSARTNQSVSWLVNDAVRLHLAAHDEDSSTLKARKNDPLRPRRTGALRRR